jgi:hypothetical protein
MEMEEENGISSLTESYLQCERNRGVTFQLTASLFCQYAT